MEDFRGLIKRLEQEGELLRVHREVDARYISGLVSQSEKAIYFERVAGFDFPVLSGLLNTRKRVALAMKVSEADIGRKFQNACDHPFQPVVVKTAPVQETVYTGDQVDLSMLPIPFLHEKDGGPYISGGVICSWDAEYGHNAGMYRLMYRKKNETGIDLVSPSDMRLYYQRAYDQGKSLKIAVAIGTHPNVMLSASYKASIDRNEFEIAGGLHGEPLELVKCITSDLLVPANSEIVLECEILPVGWVYDEGRFGEFSHIQGDLKWNPLVKVNAITHRKDAIFYALHMPWENDWLSGPVTEAAALRVLREASVEAVAVRATLGSCCYWEIIASIRKRPGEGKNALLALMSLAEVKKVIVTDDDINIYDPDDLDWAMTFRVQADQDVIIVSGARGKHIDPSLKSWMYSKDALPTTAKLGIDATIPEGVPRSKYERLKHSYKEEVNLEDYIDGQGGKSS